MTVSGFSDKQKASFGAGPTHSYLAVECIDLADVVASRAAWDAGIPEMRRDPSDAQAIRGHVTLVVVQSADDRERQAPRQRMALDQALWKHLLTEVDFANIQTSLAGGATLEAALEAEVNVLEVNYRHAACQTAWTSTWSCACDDECPACGAAVAAVDHAELCVIAQGDDGVWGLRQTPCDLQSQPGPTAAARIRP